MRESYRKRAPTGKSEGYPRVESKATWPTLMDRTIAPEAFEQLDAETKFLCGEKKRHLAVLDGSSSSKSGASPTKMAAKIDQVRKHLTKAERINDIEKNGE